MSDVAVLVAAPMLLIAFFAFARNNAGRVGDLPPRNINYDERGGINYESMSPGRLIPPPPPYFNDAESRPALASASGVPTQQMMSMFAPQPYVSAPSLWLPRHAQPAVPQSFFKAINKLNPAAATVPPVTSPPPKPTAAAVSPGPTTTPSSPAATGVTPPKPAPSPTAAPSPAAAPSATPATLTNTGIYNMIGDRIASKMVDIRKSSNWKGVDKLLFGDPSKILKANNLKYKLEKVGECEKNGKTIFIHGCTITHESNTTLQPASVFFVLDTSDSFDNTKDVNYFKQLIKIHRHTWSVAKYIIDTYTPDIVEKAMEKIDPPFGIDFELSANLDISIRQKVYDYILNNLDKCDKFDILKQYSDDQYQVVNEMVNRTIIGILCDTVSSDITVLLADWKTTKHFLAQGNIQNRAIEFTKQIFKRCVEFMTKNKTVVDQYNDEYVRTKKHTALIDDIKQKIIDQFAGITKREIEWMLHLLCKYL